MFLNKFVTLVLVCFAAGANAQSEIPGLLKSVYKIKSQVISANGKAAETTRDRSRNCGDVIRPVINARDGRVMVALNAIHGFEWSEGTAPAESLGECRTHAIKKIEKSANESSLMIMHAEQCPDGQSIVGSIREDYAFYGDTIVYRNGFVVLQDGQWRTDDTKMSYTCTWSVK